MAQIEWDELPDSRRVEGFRAELLARIGNEEARVPFNGGWLNYADATHTEGSPEAIAADTPTQLTIDGAGASSVDEYRRGVNTDVWSDNTFRPASIGETYIIRVTMKVAKSTSSDTTVELDLGIGSGYSTIIADERKPLTKGQGVTDNLSFVFPVFCLGTFGLNGGRFFINATNGITVWSKAIFVQRMFTP